MTRSPLVHALTATHHEEQTTKPSNSESDTDACLLLLPGLLPVSADFAAVGLGRLLNLDERTSLHSSVHKQVSKFTQHSTSTLHGIRVSMQQSSQAALRVLPLYQGAVIHGANALL